MNITRLSMSILTLITSSIALSACNSGTVDSATENNDTATIEMGSIDPVGDVMTASDPENNDTAIIEMSSIDPVSEVLTASSPEIQNTAPVANAGANKSAITGSSVSLDARGSSDADNDTLTYSWSLITVPVGSTIELSLLTAANPTFTPDTSGTYIFEVAVNDGKATTTDQITITVGEVTSTAGVLCDYSQSILNESEFVNATSEATWSCTDTHRKLSANGLPDHATGEFPNDGNPNTISAQTVTASFTLSPIKSETITMLNSPNSAIGYALNGVIINTSTIGSCNDTATSNAGCSLNDNTGNWSIETLAPSGLTKNFDLGIDDNNAHVQSDGTYHYHGIPEGFVSLQGGNSSKMTMIGWAVDGFPIYASYGYSKATDATSSLRKMAGSYRLVDTISNTRPSAEAFPLGTFAEDWEYVQGFGDLDECNGRFGVTPEFPNGIFHYYSTDSYPYFQRCVSGTFKTEGTLLPPPPPPG